MCPERHVRHERLLHLCLMWDKYLAHSEMTNSNSEREYNTVILDHFNIGIKSFRNVENQTLHHLFVIRLTFIPTFFFHCYLGPIHQSEDDYSAPPTPLVGQFQVLLPLRINQSMCYYCRPHPGSIRLLLSNGCILNAKTKKKSWLLVAWLKACFSWMFLLNPVVWQI